MLGGLNALKVYGEKRYHRKLAIKKGINTGELLQVITDCPGSFRNVPEEAIAHGYKFAQDPIKN